MRLLRVLATILGSTWLFPVSCSTGLVLGTDIVAALDARDVKKGDTVHGLFKVTAEPGEDGRPFRVLQIDQIARNSGKGVARVADATWTFRMSAPAGSMHFVGSKFEYHVLEDTGREQLIELVETYDDGDNTIWSRYTATAASISPVSSRMFYFGYMFGAFPHAFVGAFLVYRVGRLLRRKWSASTVASVSGRGDR